MTPEPFTDADGNPLARPLIVVERPRCEQCDGTQFKVTRSIEQCDGTRKQSAICKGCGSKVFIIWE